MTSEQQKAYDLQQSGMSRQEIASNMGISVHSVKRRLSAARKWVDADPSIAAAAKAAGMDSPASLSHFWKIGKDDDGNGYSLFVKNPDTGESFDYSEKLFDAFRELPARKKFKAATPNTDGKLCTFYNIVDHHLAMMAWGQETGEEYDLRIGIDRLTESMATLVQAAPKSGTAVVLNLGDFFHSHDDSATTKQSGHNLDVDGRHYKVLLAGVELTVACIDMAAEKHSKVVYRALRGNHDDGPHAALTIALYHHYRNCDNVEIEINASDFFSYQWGRNMVCGHHGDKAKAERLVLHMADHWPEMWGATHWRFLWTGHIHHDSAKDIGGVSWESFRTLAPKDAYAASHAYSSRQTMAAITLHKDFGEVLRNKVQIIPPRFKS